MQNIVRNKKSGLSYCIEIQTMFTENINYEKAFFSLFIFEASKLHRSSIL